MAELADAPDLGSGGETRGGSSPPFRTNHVHSGAASHLLTGSFTFCPASSYRFPFHAFR